MQKDVLKHILVVDDEDEYRDMIRKMLLRLDYVCESARDGSEAMEKLRAGHFDLVISDIRMPDKDGIALMQEARGEYPDTEFVIMTGFAGEYSYSDIIAAGATDFISKPFDMRKLKSKIERIEREKRTLARLKWESAFNASIAELSKALIGLSSFDEICDLVLGNARRITRSPVGFAGFIDSRTGFLVVPTITREAWDTCKLTSREPVFRIFKGLWGWVLENRRSLLTNQPSQDPRSSGVPEGHTHIGRFLAAPALAGEDLLGIVAVANSDRDYGEDDLKVMESVAAIFAVAVQRTRMEKEIAEARDRLDHVFDNAAEAIAIVNERGRFTKWNQAAVKLFGYGPEELEGKSFADLYTEKDRLENMLESLRRDGFVRGREVCLRLKNGEVRPFEVSVGLLRDPEGKTIGSVTVAMDLSGVRKALADLRTAHAKLQEEIGRRTAVEEELRKAQAELEVLVEERTAKLYRAGDLLKRSIDRFKEITEEGTESAPRDQ